MLGKMKMFGMSVIGLILFVSVSAWAAGSHQGKVVQAGSGKLTRSWRPGKRAMTLLSKPYAPKT